ncbi:lysostaphin resistance A-like protein [candidate division KSB1 bacterium]
MPLSSLFYTESGLRTVWKIVIFLAVTLGLLTVLFYPAMFLPLDVLFKDTRLLIIINSFPIFIAVLFSSWTILRFVERKKFAVLGFAFHNTFTGEIKKGLILGSGIISIVFLVSLLTNAVSVSWSGAGISLLIINFIIYAFIFFIQCAGEEAFFRGYLFQIIMEKINKITAVVIMSVLFSIVHMLNPEISIFALCNVFLFGVLLSAAYIKTRSLWLPTALHFSWNFSQSFIFSFPVSGIKLNHTIFAVRNNGSVLISGGEFGPEASLLTSIVTLIVIAYIIVSEKFSISDDMKTILKYNGKEKENDEDKRNL